MDRTWKFVVTGCVSKPRLNSMCTLIIMYAITNRELCVCCRSVVLSVLGRLSCWILIKRDGEVCCAYCNCMAGLGETCTCTHFCCFFFFYLEAAARIQGKQTCTQRKCKWILPSFQKDVEYLPIKDIDFTSVKGKKRNLDESVGCTLPKKSFSNSNTARITPSNEDYEAFYEHLSKSDTNQPFSL